MSKVDDELTRRFRGAEPPVDVDELFVGLERRREHHRRVRRIEVGALAVVVLLATVAGFALLSGIFGNRATDVGNAAPLPANGEIVFSKRGDDGRFHIFAAQADGSGVRQLTHVETNDTDPAVSPDGRWITFVRETSDPLPDIVTVPLDDPDVEPVEPRFSAGAQSPEPAWSTDGSMIATAEFGHEDPEDDALMIDPVIGDRFAAYFSAPGGILAHPSWGPGSRIAFATLGPPGARDTGWDLGTVSIDGTRLQSVIAEDGDQTAPTWASDGSRIAFIQGGDHGDEIWTIRPDGTDRRLIATAIDDSFEPDLTWVADGSALLVSDGEWIYGVDATPEGDPFHNLVQIVRGASPAWRPIAEGSEPWIVPSRAPSVAASPTPEGRDIGLELPMCDLEVLEHIDWDGTGVDGTAWTGATVDEDGSCRSAERRPHVVAVDRDGDGDAERGSTWTLGICLLCRPFDTVDFSDDGVRELVVLEEAASTPVYSVFEVSVNERAPGVYPILVAPPGAPAMNLRPGEPLRLTVGGDEAFSGGVRCIGREPVIEYTWANGGVDVTTDLEIDVARFVITPDGAEVRSVDEYSIPLDAPDPIARGPQCGVNWYPAP